MLYSGVKPWVNDFRYRVLAWHYKFYMQKRAKELLLASQEDLEGETKRAFRALGEHVSPGLSKSDKVTLDQHTKETGNVFHPSISRYFRWKTFIPSVTPFKSSSSPFCRVSHNATGWIDAEERKIPDLQPRGSKHKVGGSDDSVPIMPRPR